MQVSSLRATARRSSNFSHTISIRDHQLVTDEARSVGGDDEGPNPEELLAASLASCTAITIEMYAQRKGWDVGPVEIDVQYTPAERGCPTKFELVLHLASSLSDEQVEQLRVIAAKCPIHRTLDGEVMFSERVERVNLAR
ncbi:MAG: OsmC family protein [Solirubrobacteraceae bacterium]|jgi:putative redox protein